tara:strand:+ start:102 stop:326 length:225 start_codon:yes stop_codon:yes gene_type:complete
VHICIINNERSDTLNNELETQLEKLQNMDKYERVHYWLMNELDRTIETYDIDESIIGWLKMLRESYVYNLNKEF